MNTIKGIIIKGIPYKDNAQIVRIFTKEHGLATFMVRLGNPKSSSLRHVCRVMNLVEFEAQIHDDKDLHQLKQLRLAYPVNTIPFDPSKSALVLFLGELLAKTLPDKYYNKPLYQFIHDAILLLDDSYEIQNFHLWCTTEIIRHYGFYPEPNSLLPAIVHFDLLENEFRRNAPPHPYFLGPSEALLLDQFLDKDWSEVQHIQSNGAMRKSLLEGLLQMINLHLELKVTYNSLDVLHQVFHD